MARRSFQWRLNHLVHNCLAHPLLPIAELCDNTVFNSVADVIFAFHDVTSPPEDAYNKKTFGAVK